MFDESSPLDFDQQGIVFDFIQKKLRKRGISSGAFSYGHEGAFDHVRALMDNPMVTRILAPGDHVTRVEQVPEIHRRIPVASDPWFLWAFNNILPQIRNGEFDITSEEPVIRSLAPILARYPGLRPLLCPDSPDDIKISQTFHVQTMSVRDTFDSNAKYHIKEMRYESWSTGFSMRYPSDGPPWIQQLGHEHTPEEALGSYYGGYLAFPVGMGGVQEAWALVSETMGQDGECSWINPEDVEPEDLTDPYKPVEGKGVFPPDLQEVNAILGKRILEFAYLPSDYNLEVPALTFDGFMPPDPLLWARYYLPMEGKFPMPGEFVAMVCKTLPHVVWWFQDSQPFIYSGNWFETEFYTSGVIQEVIVPDEDVEDFRTVYKVLCKGEEVYLHSTDFLEYYVGERVAIIKRQDQWDKNFDWSQMVWTFPVPENLEEQIELDDFLSEKTPWDLAEIDKFIAPITFYEGDE